MERSLLRGISLVRSDRTGAAGKAGTGPAVLAVSFEMLPASGMIVGLPRRERGDRAGREARSARTLFARVRGSYPRAQVHPLTQSDCAAIGMPKPPSRMDQQPQRRAMHRLRPERPCLEIEPRRAAERIKGRALEFICDAVDQPLRPSVERVGQTVAKFGRRGEHRPLVGPCPAEQYDRQTWRGVGHRWHRVCGLGVKGAPERKAEPLCGLNQPTKSRCRHEPLAAAGPERE
jgi:hypothetical protein